MELDQLKNLITNYAVESGYILNEYSDLISFKVEDNTVGLSDTIFVDIIQSDNPDILKNTIVFSGNGIPFNPLLESEKLKAISLLRANSTMRTNGYWAIEYSYGTYWANYIVDMYEDGLNIQTLQASVFTILSAKKNLGKLMEKPFHVN